MLEKTRTGNLQADDVKDMMLPHILREE